MRTYFKLPCPNCREILPTRAEYFGKRVACKRCKHVFVADAKDVITQVAPAPTAPPQDIAAAEAQQRVALLEETLRQVCDEAAARLGDHATAVQDAERARQEAAELAEQLQTRRREADAAAERQRQEAGARDKELEDRRTETESLRMQVARLQEVETRAAATEAQLRDELTATEATTQELDSIRAERDHLRAEAEQDRAELGQLRDDLAAGEAHARELDTLRAERDQLRDDGDRVRAEHKYLTGELATVRTEREELARAKQDVERQAEQLRAKIGELEQGHSQATGAHGELARTYEEARGRWETERQELHGRWEEKHRALAQEAEERLRAEQDRAATEREQHQQEQKSLAPRLDALKQERDQFADRLAKLESARAEAEQGFRDERDRLNAALEESRRGQTENGAEEAARREDQVRALRQELAAAQADVARLNRLVGELQSRVSQVSEEAEARIQRELTDTAQLRDELTAARAAHRQLTEQLAALRSEHDQLQEQSSQAPGAGPPQHEWDGNVIRKALEGVSTRVGWPWFDTAKKEETAPARAEVARRAEDAPATADAPGLEQRLAAVQQEFNRERLALQNEVARLKKETNLLRQYLENFGVQLIDS